MIRTEFVRRLRALPLGGQLALLTGIACLAFPTVIRAAANGVVTGCEFTPYLPFVLLAAILLRWWQSSMVALAAVLILGGAFITPVHDLQCFQSAAAVYLASAAAIIAIVVLIRTSLSALDSRRADESLGGILFSVDKGEVWASWYGQDEPVLLGSKRKVSEMMEDFLTQHGAPRRLTDEH
jgi:hypothetical protein